jgi:DNA polymerase type B, organellar and viral
MDFTKWGTVDFLNDYKEAIVYKYKSKAEYHIKIFDNYTKVEYKIEDKIINTFKDEMLDVNNLATFLRTFKNQIYNFEDGEIILKRKINNVHKLKSKREDVHYNNKFICMDIETRNLKGELIPYAVCLYDGKESKSWYLLDYKDSEEMLISSIKYIMKRKYQGYKVYFHNFSNFDGIYYIRLLTTLSDNIKPIIKDNDIIDIILKFAKKNNISFRDSYLMLPASLRNLATAFKVEDKGYFPFSFADNHRLDYIGPFPKFKYFKKCKVTKEEYRKLHLESKNNWNLQEETIKYCLNDCIILHKIIDKFSKEIFSLFRINILNYPTLSSLAFGIFRTRFYDKENIPLITGSMYNFIKEGYSGGAVDVYKPYGKKIFRYDVNSLYPNTMLKNPMPIGNPTYFEGDITKIEPKAFGFFNVDVITPEYLKYPILLTKIKTKNGGIRTIAPLGTWNGIYSSIEINKCKELGYKFKILSGITFETENIFEKYVDFFYNLKKNSEKNSPHYIISKLLLNTLYGRFGMNPCLEKHKIIKSSEIYYFEKMYNLIDSLDLNNGKELVTYTGFEEEDIFYIPSVSVSIAASVTSYARVLMSQYKNNSNFNLYYSDTDSIDIDKPLDSKFIGNEIGKMKLESIFDEIVYLAPKVYAAKLKGKDFIKVKGLKLPYSYKDLFRLKGVKNPVSLKDFKIFW